MERGLEDSDIPSVSVVAEDSAVAKVTQSDQTLTNHVFEIVASPGVCSIFQSQLVQTGGVAVAAILAVTFLIHALARLVRDSKPAS